MSKLFCIVGETASGKDSIVNGISLNHIENADNSLHKVISYTTRKMRDNETNGVEHYFVTDDEYDKIHNTNKIIAETKIGEYRYMATEDECLKSDIYIIDPNGLKNLKNNINMDLIDIVVIYIRVPYEERIRRASARSDFNDEFKQRVLSENEQFREFFMSKEYDYIILNNESLESAIKQIENIINYEINKKK